MIQLYMVMQQKTRVDLHEKISHDRTQINNATVIAVGPGTVNEKGEAIPCGIKPGDQVLLPEFGGTKVEVDTGVDMYLFREADLLGKWES